MPGRTGYKARTEIRQNLFHSIFQQKKSAVFAKGVEESYDAYDKDIAVASFFFKKHTMFQYRK